jgi:hypothetical protein
MSILEFLGDINGIAQLWAPDGQFLGWLSSDSFDQTSISNPSGLYGSSSGIYSIRNPSGMYGSASGMYSPYNINSLYPPVIVYRGQPVLVVTKNPCVLTKGLPIVDPDLMLSVYTKQVTLDPVAA